MLATISRWELTTVARIATILLQISGKCGSIFYLGDDEFGHKINNTRLIMHTDKPHLGDVGLELQYLLEFHA